MTEKINKLKTKQLSISQFYVIFVILCTCIGMAKLRSSSALQRLR